MVAASWLFAPSHVIIRSERNKMAAAPTLGTRLHTCHTHAARLRFPQSASLCPLGTLEHSTGRRWSDRDRQPHLLLSLPPASRWENHPSSAWVGGWGGGGSHGRPRVRFPPSCSLHPVLKHTSRI